MSPLFGSEFDTGFYLVHILHICKARCFGQPNLSQIEHGKIGLSVGRYGFPKK